MLVYKKQASDEKAPTLDFRSLWANFYLMTDGKRDWFLNCFSVFAVFAAHHRAVGKSHGELQVALQKS